MALKLLTEFTGLIIGRQESKRAKILQISNFSYSIIPFCSVFFTWGGGKYKIFLKKTGVVIGFTRRSEIEGRVFSN